MNRLNFIKNASLVATSLFLLPHTSFSNNNLSFGNKLEGINFLSSFGEKMSLEQLNKDGIIEQLNAKNFSIDNNLVIKFNKNCYLKPIQKTLFFSSQINLLIITRKNGNFEYTILNEEFSKEYSKFIVDYNNVIKYNTISEDTILNFVPKNVIKNSKKEVEFKTTDNSILKIKKNKNKLSTFILNN